MKHKIDASNENITRTIDNYINGFKAERNRSILKRRLLDGVTFECLAEEFDMSVMQIKNIVYKGMEIISVHLRVEV